MFRQEVLDRIKVITHSCVRIGGEKVIYIDPVGIKGAPHDADIIFFTHLHLDHFSPLEARKLMKDDTVIVAPKSMALPCRLFLSSKGSTHVMLVPGQETQISGIPVKAVAAYNNKKPFHPKGNGWLGYVLTIDGTDIYITGDTDITSECSSVSCDILMLPVGGFFTIDAAEAAQLTNTVAPHTVIPIHYGLCNGGKDAPERFRSRVNDGIITDIRPEVYNSIVLMMYVKAFAAAAAVFLITYLLLR